MVEIDAKWLVPCSGELAPRTDWTVGGLLQDNADAAAILLPCAARYNSLLDYLIPVVEKEKARPFGATN